MANALLERAIPKDDPKQAGWAAPASAPTDTSAGGTQLPPITRTDAMTTGGVTSATAVLFVILLAFGAWGWSLVESAPEGQSTFPGWIIIPALVAFGLAMVAAFKPHLARFLAPLYAAGQGIVLGAISRAYENEFDGIVVQAVLITAIVFATMLFLYATRIIRVTERMRRVIIFATIGYCVFLFVSLLLSLFNVGVPLLWDTGPLGILFSVAICGLAAFNLMLDFDLAERGVAAGLPKYMEWYCGLALMVSIVWLYLEILRLLAKLRQ